MCESVDKNQIQSILIVENFEFAWKQNKPGVEFGQIDVPRHFEGGRR